MVEILRNPEINLRGIELSENLETRTRERIVSQQLAPITISNSAF